MNEKEIKDTNQWTIKNRLNRNKKFIIDTIKHSFFIRRLSTNTWINKGIGVQYSTVINTEQGWIQDFPEVGAPTCGGAGVAPTYNFPKNCMKLKEFRPRRRPKFYFTV